MNKMVLALLNLLGSARVVFAQTTLNSGYSDPCSSAGVQAILVSFLLLIFLAILVIVLSVKYCKKLKIAALSSMLSFFVISALTTHFAEQIRFYFRVKCGGPLLGASPEAGYMILRNMKLTTFEYFTNPYYIVSDWRDVLMQAFAFSAFVGLITLLVGWIVKKIRRTPTI